MTTASTLVQHLPPWLVSAASALAGWRLQRWRYGADSAELVAAARQREHWTAEEWQAFVAPRLATLLERAAHRVPGYAGTVAPQGAAPAPLEGWPLLAKDTVRLDPRAFLCADCRPRRMYREHTSGTSGTPLDLWWSRDTVRQVYALLEARWRNWYGVTRHDRWAILGGRLLVPAARERPPFWVWNASMHQLYMSVYHLRADWVPHYLAALHRYRVTYLWGYSSALHVLAQEALRLGWAPPPLKVVITNAEPLYDYQREAIATAFRCPVRETYGNAEIVAAASECERGRMHLWPDMGIVEVLVDGTGDIRPWGTGELVCTGLLNQDMPLVRYRIGDRATVLPPDVRCACGRSLPLIENIEGRTDDVLVTPDGRRIGRLDPVFKAGLPLCEAQIVQDAPDHVTVHCVPAPGFDETTAAEIRQRLRQRLGGMTVQVQCMDRIPRTRNGKFRAVVNAVSATPRPPAAAGGSTPESSSL